MLFFSSLAMLKTRNSRNSELETIQNCGSILLVPIFTGLMFYQAASLGSWHQGHFSCYSYNEQTTGPSRILHPGKSYTCPKLIQDEQKLY